MSLLYKLLCRVWDSPRFDRRYGRTLYKRMCKLGDPPDAPFETDFFGYRYRGNLKNSIDFSVYYYGAFEKPLLYFMRDTMKSLAHSSAVYCDIGANIGQHALYMSRHAARVHAFEPWAVVRSRIQELVELNSIENLEIHPLGLSDSSQTLPFYAPTGRNQGIGSFDASTVTKGNEKIGDLALVRGDEYFQSHGIQPVVLAKIDVEGFEKAVLTGLRETLASQRPIVVCELTYGKPLSISSCEELAALFPDRYRFFTFDTRKADGSKARRQGAKARLSGDYHLVPFNTFPKQGQDDIVACPAELVDRLPQGSESV